jgi:selenide,water dikinase
VKTTNQDPALLVGLDAPDDAAVYRITDDIAIVQTVDFFTPIVDDPHAWGRIAAANALSDVYAMGGKPVTALNLIGWPRALDLEILGRVLEGAGETCDLAGVAIVGGHSVDDPEPKFGLSVTGTVHPDRIVRKSGAPAGSILVLTKPLGMGIISSGIKDGLTSLETAQVATEVMARLNADAAEAMIEIGVSAATDVTGFGLIGHLLGMLGDSLDASLDFGSIPVLNEAFDLAAQGVLPGGSRRNLEAMRDKVELGDLNDAASVVLFDAQTSGGLLIAVDPAKVESLVAALGTRGVTGAVIGAVGAGTGRVEVVGE